MAREGWLPLITAGQEPVFAADPDTLDAVLADSFEPQQVVYLPLTAQNRVHAQARANAKILSPQYSVQRIGMDVEADAPAMVVVAQSFCHNWHAYVDGQTVPLWRANYAFQALEVPAGRHQVSLVYEDKAFRYGAILSLVALAACAAAWFCRHTPRNRRPSVNREG